MIVAPAVLFQGTRIVVSTSQRRRVVLGRHQQLTAALAEIQRQLTSDQCQEVLQLVEHAWVCAALCRSVEQQQEQVSPFASCSDPEVNGRACRRCSLQPHTQNTIR